MCHLLLYVSVDEVTQKTSYLARRSGKEGKGRPTGREGGKQRPAQPKQAPRPPYVRHRSGQNTTEHTHNHATSCCHPVLAPRWRPLKSCTNNHTNEGFRSPSANKHKTKTNKQTIRKIRGKAREPESSKDVAMHRTFLLTPHTNTPVLSSCCRDVRI